MVRERLFRWLAACALADGLLLLAGGRGYARLWQAIPGPAPYRRSAAWFTRLPTWTLRLAGLGEMALGLVILGQAPVGVKDLYRLGAGVYDPMNVVWRGWLFPHVHRLFDHYLADYLQPGDRVLDLGCGTGANLERLVDLELPFGSYVGVDQSEEMLAVARTRFGRLEKASFLRLDLMADPLPEGPFDLVTSTWVFSHLPDPRLVVDKAMERLREDGHMVLLFIGKPRGWWSRLLGSTLQPFSTYPVREETYLAFPRRVHLHRFAGGSLVAMVLRK